MSLTPRIDNIESSENMIINGGMDFAQRSVGPVAATLTPAYDTVDRWTIDAVSTANFTSAQVVGDTPNESFEKTLNLVSTSTTLHSKAIWQRIEANTIQKYVGEYVTLSFYVKQTGQVTGLQFEVYVPTAGTPDGWVDITTTSETQIHIDFRPDTDFSLDTWSRISTTFLVPSSARFGMGIGLRSTVGVTTNGATLKVTGAMLSPGTTLGKFRLAGTHIGAEFELCRRYFRKVIAGVNINHSVVFIAIGSTSVRTTFLFTIGMRTTVGRLYSIGSNMRLISASGVVVDSSVTFDQASLVAITNYVVVGAATLSSYLLASSASGSSTLNADAEL